MQGYWNKPEQTASVLRDGWYHTGDLGFLDPEGCLHLVDRAKDMIVSGSCVQRGACRDGCMRARTFPLVLGVASESGPFATEPESWSLRRHKGP